MSGVAVNSEWLHAETSIIAVRGNGWNLETPGWSASMHARLCTRCQVLVVVCRLAGDGVLSFSGPAAQSGHLPHQQPGDDEHGYDHDSHHDVEDRLPPNGV